MLPQTPKINYDPNNIAIETPTPKPTAMVKFYADAPDGTKNKYLTYLVHDFSHALNLLRRFITNGWKIRQAYFQTSIGTSLKIERGTYDI